VSLISLVPSACESSIAYELKVGELCDNEDPALSYEDNVLRCKPGIEEGRRKVCILAKMQSEVKLVSTFQL